MYKRYIAYKFQLTKRLNYPTTKSIYKNLIPLNVKDTNLITTSKPRINWHKYKRSANQQRDPEPDLDDFMQPEPEIKYRLPVDKSCSPGTKSLFNPFKTFSEYYENKISGFDE